MQDTRKRSSFYADGSVFFVRKFCGTIGMQLRGSASFCVGATL